MGSGRVTFTDYGFGFAPGSAPVNTFYPGVIVGSDPWDDNPATYTEATVSVRPGPVSYADGQYATMVAPAGMGSPLTGWTLEVDCSAVNIGGTGPAYRWSFAMYDIPGGSYDGDAFIDYVDEWDFGSPTQEMSTNAPHTETGIGFYGGLSLATLEAAILEGWSISTRRLSNSGETPPTDYKLRISRVDLRVTWDSASVVRQYPRDDEQGWGSGARLYPPPKANRIVGGLQ